MSTGFTLDILNQLTAAGFAPGAPIGAPKPKSEWTVETVKIKDLRDLPHENRYNLPADDYKRLKSSSRADQIIQVIKDGEGQIAAIYKKEPFYATWILGSGVTLAVKNNELELLDNRNRSAFMVAYDPKKLYSTTVRGAEKDKSAKVDFHEKTGSKEKFEIAFQRGKIKPIIGKETHELKFLIGDNRINIEEGNPSHMLDVSLRASDFVLKNFAVEKYEPAVSESKPATKFSPPRHGVRHDSGQADIALGNGISIRMRPWRPGSDGNDFPGNLNPYYNVSIGTGLVSQQLVEHGNLLPKIEMEDGVKNLMWRTPAPPAPAKPPKGFGK